MWFDCVLWMSFCLIEWLVWFDETEGKRGLTGCDVSFHAVFCTFCSIICA